MGGGGKNELALVDAPVFGVDDKPKKSVFNSFDGNGTTRKFFIRIDLLKLLSSYLLEGRVQVRNWLHMRQRCHRLVR